MEDALLEGKQGQGYGDAGFDLDERSGVDQPGPVVCSRRTKGIGNLGQAETFELEKNDFAY